ncbi:unnamed protein product [Closterium sp. Naga37s-1]|nr:unnamed protein product [Closterium sp. Naga37s-1]
MALDSTVALSGTSAARNSAARAAPRAVHTGVRSSLEAPQKSTLHTGGMRSHCHVSRWNRSIRLTRRPPALLVSLLVVVAVLGNCSSRGSSSSLPRYTPCCSPSPHSTLAPHSPHSTLAPHSPHSTLAPHSPHSPLAPLARLARIAPDAHHSINALQRVSRRLLQESSASPSGKSHPPRTLPAPSSPRMRAAPSSCIYSFSPLVPPLPRPAPPPTPARANLSDGWRIRLQSRPLLVSFIATVLCAAIILVIASIGFCMCCRQGTRVESSFDEVFLADYMARSTHHYDPLLKLGSGPFGDSFPCSGPEGEPWLVVRATIPDGLAGATWLPWTGAAAKRRAFNEEIIRFSGLSHPHLLHLIGWSDQPLGQAGGSGRLRQVGESMRQWAQILWRKRGTQEQGGGGGSGHGVGGGSGRGEGRGSVRGDGVGSVQAVVRGVRAEPVGAEGAGIEGGRDTGEGDEREEVEEGGKQVDQSASSFDCRVEVGGEGVGKGRTVTPTAGFSQHLDIATSVAEALCHLHTSADPSFPFCQLPFPHPPIPLPLTTSDAQSPQPLAFSQRLDIATAVAEALCHLHTVARPPLVHRRLCSSSVFLKVLPVARLANLGIIKGLPSSPCLMQQCHVAASHRDPDCLGIIMLELLSGCPATTTDQATASTATFDVHQMLHSIAADDLATVLDFFLSAQSMPFRPIRSFARLAARCAARAARSRPDISTVVSELQGIS